MSNGHNYRRYSIAVGVCAHASKKKSFEIDFEYAVPNTKPTEVSVSDDHSVTVRGIT